MRAKAQTDKDGSGELQLLDDLKQRGPDPLDVVCVLPSHTDQPTWCRHRTYAPNTFLSTLVVTGICIVKLV